MTHDQKMAITWIVILTTMWVAIKVYRRMRRQFATTHTESTQALRDAVARTYLTDLAAHVQGIIDAGGKGVALPTPLNPVKYGYLPISREQLLAAMPVSLIEVVATGANRAFRSYDNTGYYRREVEERATAEGMLLLTTQALVFQSDKRSDRLLWSKISRIDTWAWTFKVHRRSGKPMTFGFYQPNLEFAKALVVLANKAD